MIGLLLVLTLASPQAQPQTEASKAALLTRASAAIQAGRRDEAKQLLRTAAERFESVQALLQLARLQSADGDAAAALDSLRRARALAPNAEDVLNAFAQVSLAARMPVPAILTLEALTRLCPTVAQYHYLLGVGLMTAGDMIPAIEALKLADAREPNTPLTLIALGLAYNNQKRYPEARDALVAAAEADPRSPKPEYQLSLVYARLGDEANAQRHVERYQQKLRDMEATVKALHEAGFSGGAE